MNNRLSGLDGLRGIAALSVLGFHASGGNGNGFLAVDLFFMLSGYVMARTFEGRLGHGLTAFGFMKKRYARLWPTLAICGLLAAPLFLRQFGIEAWPFVVANLLLIPTMRVNRIYPLNGPTWSILLELIANALHGIVLHRMSRRSLAMVAAVALACFAALSGMAGTTNLGPTPDLFIAGIPRLIFSYSTGILLFRCWQDRPPININPWLTYLLMPAVFVTSEITGVHPWGLDLLFVAVGCPLMMAGALRPIRFEREARWLGSISFPLYAVHTPIFGYAELLGLNRGVTGVASILAAAGLAKLLDRRSTGALPMTSLSDGVSPDAPSAVATQMA